MDQAHQISKIESVPRMATYSRVPNKRHMTLILFLGNIPLWRAYLGHDAYSFFRKNPLMTIITVMTLISSQALCLNLELFKFLLSYFGQKALVMQSWMQNNPRVGRFAFSNNYLRHLYQIHFHSIWLLKLLTFIYFILNLSIKSTYIWFKLFAYTD